MRRGRSLGKALAITGVHARRLTRDRTALFFMFALPVLLILIVGIAIGGGSGRLPVGVLDQGSGPLGADLRAQLQVEPRLKVQRFNHLDTLTRAVRRGEVVAGVVLPGRMDATVRAGGQAVVGFIADPTSSLAVTVRSAVDAAVTRQDAVVRAARFASVESGQALDTTINRARTLSGAVSGVRVDQFATRARGVLPGGFRYTAPSNLVLFVFIASLAGTAVFVEARRLGVIRRVLASPTSATTVLVGEGLARFGIALLQSAFILAVGAIVFGVHWGNPAGAAALVVVFAAVAAAVGMLVATLVRTSEQAIAVGPPIGIALGMLGGCMWPLEIVGPLMRRIGHLTPHAWAMDAFIRLIGDGAGLGQISADLAVLGGFFIVLLPLGAWRLRRTITA